MDGFSIGVLEDKQKRLVTSLYHLIYHLVPLMTNLADTSIIKRNPQAVKRALEEGGVVFHVVTHHSHQLPLRVHCLHFRAVEEFVEENFIFDARHKVPDVGDFGGFRVPHQADGDYIRLSEEGSYQGGFEGASLRTR